MMPKQKRMHAVIVYDIADMVEGGLRHRYEILMSDVGNIANDYSLSKILDYLCSKAITSYCQEERRISVISPVEEHVIISDGRLYSIADRLWAEFEYKLVNFFRVKTPRIYNSCWIRTSATPTTCVVIVGDPLDAL